MTFQPILHPVLLAVLWLPAVAAAVYALVTTPQNRRLWAGRIVMLMAILVLLVRPGIPGGSTETLATDTDIVLVVDTTASIVAEDWNDGEQRLDGVRDDVAALIAEYPGARFALITFDAAAELRLPLTTDTTALSSSLDVLRPEVTAYSHGSSIAIAHTMLEETLGNAASSSPERSRMVFYFGDGEQTATTKPESFASSAPLVDAGAVFGYGTAEGGPMKITTGTVDAPSGGYIEYQGNAALSVIDEKNLTAVADQLGVPYAHRDADTRPELPEAPTTTTTRSIDGEVGTVIELYWIAAAVIVLLLGVEVTRAAFLVARMRGLADSRREEER